ncbi:MAG: hypothetical protein QE271_04515 [Bacteriovoracaceae bacterium]|nr:hypothetical protein [Bacteriovoracaceae bacterium]
MRFFLLFLLFKLSTALAANCEIDGLRGKYISGTGFDQKEFIGIFYNDVQKSWFLVTRLSNLYSISENSAIAGSIAINIRENNLSLVKESGNLSINKIVDTTCLFKTWTGTNITYHSKEIKSGFVNGCITKITDDSGNECICSSTYSSYIFLPKVVGMICEKGGYYPEFEKK